MSLSCSVLLPLVVLLGASLQGCVFNTLPDPVKVAIGHQCGKKAAEEVKHDFDEIEEALGEKRHCSDLDKSKLTKFKVDCGKVMKAVVEELTGCECESKVAEKVEADCSQASEECKTATDEEVEGFSASKPDETDEQKEEEEKHFEELLAVAHNCHTESTKFYNNPANKPQIDNACGNTTALTTMGIGESHCRKWYLKMQIREGTFVCLIKGVVQAQTVGEDYFDELTLEKVQQHAKGVFMDSDPRESLDSMRLYAETAMTALKTKRWPKTLQPWSNKIVKFGAASVGALAVLVVVGMRRRTQPAEVQDHQLLMNIE